MYEEDIVLTKSRCPYASDRDDNWDTYCTKSGNCQYQKNVRDCDGNIISLCRM